MKALGRFVRRWWTLAVMFLGLSLWGCTQLQKLNVEFCYNDPEYGQVCAVRVGGEWFIKGTLAPDAIPKVLARIKEAVK